MAEEVPECIPEYLSSTVRLLKRTYPDGVPAEDYLPVLEIMSRDGMSDRNIAMAIGAYYGVDYVQYLHDVAHVLPNTTISRDEVTRVEGKLMQFGLDAWRQEE